MLKFIWSIAVFIITLSILIIVHEFGHFWVARRCGIKVERFSIGFGKTLWYRRDRHGTEYVIAIAPLGGYVKMLDERIENIASELHHQTFNSKTIPQRAAIISAGSIANFLFAIFVYWLVFIHGVSGVRPIISEIISGSVAADAQISLGMELKSVDGIETPDWDAVRMALIGKIGNSDVTIMLSSLDSSQCVKKLVDLRHLHFELDRQDPISAIGIVPYGLEIKTILADVQKNSPASEAGLQVGDKIVKVNGQPLTAWQNFANLVRKSPDKAILLDIERDNKTISLTLTPVIKDTEGFAGIIPRVLPMPEEYKIVHQYGPFTAVGEAGKKTWQLIKITVGMLGKLITGDIRLNNLSGPITIAQGAGISAKCGIIHYLMFLALISVNLGIINLFPLPSLDGGHMLFLIIEKIKGKPISQRIQDLSYHIGSILLVLLMGLALFNDCSRLL